MASVGGEFGNKLYSGFDLFEECSFCFCVKIKLLGRLVVENGKAGSVFVVDFFVDVKGGLAPVHIGFDRDVVGLFNPVFTG